MKRTGLLTATAVGLAMAAIGPAADAHSPYLQPTQFAPTRGYVAVLAALTEEVYFVPDFALRGEGFFLVDPEGRRSEIKNVAPMKSFVAAEADLPADGTYRITTGDRAGRSAKFAKIDGRWLAVRQPRPGQQQRQEGQQRQQAERQRAGQMERGGPQGAPAAGGERPRAIDEADLPAGAEIAEMRAVVVAETYVTRGAPSDAAVKPTGKGFELKPLIHPNEIFLDTGFPFEILMDGKPVEGVALEVFRGGNAYEDKKVYGEVTTDVAGRATVAFDRPGVYVLTTRYPGRPAPGEAPPPRSYSYALTVEVTL
ncbi:hypothetical protein ABIE65_004024 [Constrictibacter sp. MBR-5]|jgi:hypothetical protein|uniref:DUF4198 domain-containing protein n=1 Tax=Constrictibacter sp. MBR-5 TaxID=3156467 RepID=UPI003394E8E4